MYENYVAPAVLEVGDFTEVTAAISVGDYLDGNAHSYQSFSW
jgi:hypothetical protein